MKYRVQFRMSLNRDKGSKVRNKVKATLTKAQITQRQVVSDTSGKSTGTWEGTGLDDAGLTAMQDILELLKGLPGSVKNANKNVALDHVWLYVDRA